MTHVNLNAQPEAIRQFVLALAENTGGTILELDGRPVAYLVTPPQQQFGEQPGTAAEWTEEKNRRRCELIDRQYDHGLTPAEEAELVILQAAMDRYVERVAPLPLEAVRQLHQRLLDTATQS